MFFDNAILHHDAESWCGRLLDARGEEPYFLFFCVTVFTHGVIPGSSHTQALGISSPGIDKTHLTGPCNQEDCKMGHYVGLDVSLKLTAICIVARTGKIEREGVVAPEPETIAAFIKSHAPHVARVGLETGATSTWLWTELNKLGLPVICIDA